MYVKFIVKVDLYRPHRNLYAVIVLNWVLVTRYEIGKVPSDFETRIFAKYFSWVRMF